MEAEQKSVEGGRASAKEPGLANETVKKNYRNVSCTNQLQKSRGREGG